MLASAGDGDGLGMRVDAIFDKLRDGLERVGLREGDNSNRIPVIANAQLSAFRSRRFGSALFAQAGSPHVCLKV